MRPLRRRPRVDRVPVAVALLAVAVACGPAGGTSSGPTEDADARIAAVLELRATVGPPAAEVGSAAATVVQQVRDLHQELPVDPPDRAAAVDAIRAGALADLEAARAGIGPELTADADGADAAPVVAALAAARDAADALAGATEDELDLVARAADADARLAEVVAAWEEPGSRSQQLARLDATASAADALAAELEDGGATSDCAGLLARRARVATVVAEATRELRGLVAGRRGEEFDARRRELAAGPAASTRALVDEDRAELACRREDGALVRHAAAVAAALEDLEDALNPADLASPGSG